MAGQIRLVPVQTAAVAASAAKASAAAAAVKAALTRRSGLHWSGFIDSDVPAAKILAVQHLNGFVGFLIGRHFDKAEASGAARELVYDHLGRFHVPGLGEVLPQLIIGGAVRQTTNI